MKWYVKFFVVMLLMFVQTVFSPIAFAADGEHIDPLMASSSSKEALLKSMDDPIANKAFHEIQLQVLQTPSDALIYRYFSSSPIFSSLYEFLVKHNDELVRGFELGAKSSMLQAVRGITPKYDLIDKLVVDVASNLGFTKKAIENRQIFILGGDENAFTVSGSQNKIIVAFQRGILRTMTRTEIAAVLAHELGHIRAEHTVKGIMNSIMLEVVGELFVSGKLGVMQDGTDLTKLTEDMCIGVCTHSKDAVEKFESGTKVNNSVRFVDNEIQKFVSSIANMPKAKLQYLVGSYLQVALKVAIAENAPNQTVQYINILLQNVANIGQFKVNPTEFLQHAKMVQFALSRAKETTADQISASIVRNEYLASAFAKLIGLDFDREFRPQIFNQIKKQANEILNLVPASQLSMVVGSTHPSLVLRINNMLTVPVYPSILFANGYLRLLLLNDALVSTKYYTQEAYNSFQKQAKIQLENLDKAIAEQSGGKATPEQVAQIKNQTTEMLAKNNTTYIEKLKAIDESAKKHEAQVLGLLFSKNFPVSGVRSPRMDNTIQYLSVRKEITLESISKINAALEKVKAEAGSQITEKQAYEIESMENILKGYEHTLDSQKEFMLKIRSGLIAESKLVSNRDLFRNVNKRILSINNVLKATSSGELEKIREGVTTINPDLRENTEYRRNKIPVKLFGERAAGPVCSKLFN